MTAPADDPRPIALERPALLDTGVWTGVRDRRFPHLARWFNAEVAAGNVLVCDLVIIELTRLAPNGSRARDVAGRLDAFGAVRMPADLWPRVRALQLELAADATHRRIPPADLILAETARAAGVPLVHYDRDYARIGAVRGDLDQRWFVADGSLG